MERYSIGFEKMARYAKKFTPEYVEAQTGVYRTVVVEIAELIVKNRPRVAIFPGAGLEHHDNGVNNIRTIAALGCLCGALDTAWGLFWPEEMGGRRLTPADDGAPVKTGPIGSQRFPVFCDRVKEGHTMTAMDHMLGAAAPPLKGLVITAANPAVTNPNTAKVRAALSNLDLLVVNDFFLTPTARLADYVLPAASFLERSELHYHKKHQMVTLTTKIMEIPGVGNEYALWRDLATRLGFGDEFFPWKDETAVNRWILEPTGITLEELQRSPGGLVYKPVRYRKHQSRRLPTPSGKVEFTSAYLKQMGFPEIAEYRPPYHLRKQNVDYPLVLTTGARKSLFYHSRHQNIPRFRTVHPVAEMEIHPEDAADLGILDKETVRVVSAMGSLEIQARIASPSELRKGVVEIYHGWEQWPVNRVTFDAVNDPISGFPLLKGVPVRIEKL